MISSLSTHWHYIWLVVASFIAGVMNAMAGGGSFVSFPAMLSIGVAPIQANATNTVALWPGQLTSVAALRDDLRRDLLPVVCTASIAGGVSGAVVLLNTRQITFMHLVPWLLLIAASIFAASGPMSRWLARRRLAETGMESRTETSAGAAKKTESTQDPWPNPDGDEKQVASAGRGARLMPVFVATILVCFYVGYFGAGAGFLIITVLSLFGFKDLNEINALKVVSTTMANGMAFIIFVVDGQVVWRYCLLAMATCAVGGYTSARFARMVPQTVLRGTVIVIGFGMAVWFFWKG